MTRESECGDPPPVAPLSVIGEHVDPDWQRHSRHGEGSFSPLTMPRIHVGRAETPGGLIATIGGA